MDQFTAQFFFYSRGKLCLEQTIFWCLPGISKQAAHSYRPAGRCRRWSRRQAHHGAGRGISPLLYRPQGQPTKDQPLPAREFALYRAGIYDLAAIKELPWTDYRPFVLKLFGVREHPRTRWSTEALLSWMASASASTRAPVTAFRSTATSASIPRCSGTTSTTSI